MITLVHKWYDQYEDENYYAYDVEEEKFYENKQVKKYIKLAFTNSFRIGMSSSEMILDTFDLWEDEGLLEELLENYMKELDEIFWDDDYWNEDNIPKKDGAC